MAPKAVEAEQKAGKSRAEKKPVKTKAEKKPVKKEGSKKKKAKSIETYKIYIYKVLKQVNGVVRFSMVEKLRSFSFSRLFSSHCPNWAWLVLRRALFRFS